MLNSTSGNRTPAVKPTGWNRHDAIEFANLDSEDIPSPVDLIDLWICVSGIHFGDGRDGCNDEDN